MGEWNQARLYHEIVLPFSKVLESMEREGFYIDMEEFWDVKHVLLQKQEEKEKEIRGIAGDTNLNSTQQLGKLLYDTLKIPDSYEDYVYDYKKEKWELAPFYLRTEKGARSTDVFSLNVIAAIHNNPLAKLILEYRKLTKVLNTYINGMEEFITPDNRVHPDFFQLTAGGRLAISRPPLAQLPSRTEEGRLIKKFFVAPKGYKLVEADWSAMELRWQAWVAEDSVMHPAFQKGLDVHAITTQKLFDLSYEEAKADKKKRYIGKTINFTIIYGGSADSIQKTLLKDTGVFYDIKTCTKFVNTYFETYTGVVPLQNRVRDFILDHQYIKNMWGRYRYFPGIKRKDVSRMESLEKRDYNSQVSNAMRQGMSHLIQSSSSGDYGAYKTIKIDQMFKEKYRGKGRFYMNLYDGMYCVIKEELVEEFTQDLKNLLELPEEVCKIHIPVETSVGKSWYELK